MENYKYSFKNQTIENLSLAIYNSGYQKCLASYTWGPGLRDHYLVHYVSEGKGKLTVNRQVFEIEKGEMFMIYPGEIAAYEADADEPWEYYWVGFNGTEAKRLVQNTGFSKDSPVVRSADNEEAKKLLLSIYHARGTSSACETKMIGLLYVFLSQLMEQAAKCPADSHTKEYLQKAVRFIQYNYAGDIHVEDIAHYVGVSRSQLYRAFLQQFEISPALFLQRYRINEACSLLKNKALSIAEVACSVGFNDSLYFSRSFRKLKGMAPTKYRENFDE